MAIWHSFYPADWLARPKLVHWKRGPLEYSRAGVISVFRIGVFHFVRVGDRRAVKVKR